MRKFAVGYEAASIVKRYTGGKRRLLERCTWD
jgi:hypothetical protein